jgi:biotin transport system substrate-specific component
MSANALAPRSLDGSSFKWLTMATMVAFGVALISLAAKIQVPLWPNPTPVTLQTLAIFALSAAYGSRLAVATIMSYMLVGAFGVPVFAGPVAGPAYFAGPTGGYLAGFVVMAYITGLAADKGWSKSPFKIGGAMVAGEIIMLVMGALWMGYLFGSEKIIAWGVGPFVVTDFIKVAIAACVLPAIWGLMKKH